MKFCRLTHRHSRAPSHASLDVGTGVPPRCCRRGGRGLPGPQPPPHPTPSACPTNPIAHHTRTHVCRPPPAWGPSSARSRCPPTPSDIVDQALPPWWDREGPAPLLCGHRQPGRSVLYIYIYIYIYLIYIYACEEHRQPGRSARGIDLSLSLTGLAHQTRSDGATSRRLGQASSLKEDGLGSCEHAQLRLRVCGVSLTCVRQGAVVGTGPGG